MNLVREDPTRNIPPIPLALTLLHLPLSSSAVLSLCCAVLHTKHSAHTPKINFTFTSHHSHVVAVCCRWFLVVTHTHFSYINVSIVRLSTHTPLSVPSRPHPLPQISCVCSLVLSSYFTSISPLHRLSVCLCFLREMQSFHIKRTAKLTRETLEYGTWTVYAKKKR